VMAIVEVGSSGEGEARCMEAVMSARKIMVKDCDDELAFGGRSNVEHHVWYASEGVCRRSRILTFVQSKNLIFCQIMEKLHS